MAHNEHETAKPRGPSNSSGSTLNIGRNNKPLFARERTRPYFTGATDNATKDSNEGVESPVTARRAGGAGNWMDAKPARRLGLEEAFQRTDENGLFRPRSPQVGAGREGLRTELRSEIRAARRASYTPDATPTPPRTLSAAYRMATAEERSASAPIEGGRAQRSPIDGSPSPATRSRTLSRDSDDGRFHRLRNSDPLDLRGRNGNTLVRQNSDGNTDDGTTESSRSSLSGLSLVEDPTEDEFDEKMRKFSKDQERVAELLRRKSGPFAKRGIGSRVAETTKSLVKKTSTSSFENEAPPPYQPPRTWGSKAKKMDRFLSKVLSPDNSTEIQNPQVVQQVSNPPAKQQSTADIPLPSVESGLPVQEPTPPLSRPASAQPNNMAPWDTDLDFTAQSIMTSPQLRVKTTRLDDIRDREIQSLTRSAIASRQLEEIRERNSEERSRSPEVNRRSSKERQSKSPTPKPEPSDDEQFHEKTILEEEGESIPGTPITIFSGSSLKPNDNNNDNARDQRPGRDSKGDRAQYTRDESRDVLRRLSRATSGSPSTSRGAEEPKVEGEVKREDAKVDKGKGIETSTERDKDKTPRPLQEREFKRTERLRDDPIKRLSNGSELDRKRLSSTSTPPKSDVDPEERIAAEASLFELQDNKSERNSVRAPSPMEFEDGQVDATPRPKPDPFSRPTPRVTGAYIETPAPTVRISRFSKELLPEVGSMNTINLDGTTERNISRFLSSNNPLIRERGRAIERGQSPRSRSQPVMPTTRPPLRNTAKLSRASEDLRRIKREAQIEDSTLDDFDEILEADVRATANLSRSRIEPALDFEHDSNGRELSDREKQQRLETLALERMSNSLKRTSVSIRDAKRGIEGLEDRVTSSNNSLPGSQTGTHTHTHNNCQACANGSSMYHLSIPIPRLYNRTPPPSSRRKLTWLGLLLTVFLAWFASESIMCEYFCKPEFANYTGMWTPWEPSFPYVIPSKLDYWTGRRVSGAAYKVYKIWTDGKRPRPRWAGPRPRPPLDDPPEGYIPPQRTIVKKPRSEFWSWFWDDDVDENGDRIHIEILNPGQEIVKGKGKGKGKEKKHAQATAESWNWAGFRKSGSTSTKDKRSGGGVTWAGDGEDEDEDEGDEGSMFEDETI